MPTQHVYPDAPLFRTASQKQAERDRARANRRRRRTASDAAMLVAAHGFSEFRRECARDCGADYEVAAVERIEGRNERLFIYDVPTAEGQTRARIPINRAAIRDSRVYIDDLMAAPPLQDAIYDDEIETRDVQLVAPLLMMFFTGAMATAARADAARAVEARTARAGHERRDDRLRAAGG